jgi:hypothetical protein
LNITNLHNSCKLVGRWKSQLIGEELPHYGHNALFLQNDEITTGLINNKTEIKIHLLTGQLSYFRNEEGFTVNLKPNITEGSISNGDIHTILTQMLSEHKLKYFKLPAEIDLGFISSEELSTYHAFAVKARRCLELFRMELTGHFTLLHLWPEGFDFSVEWFTTKTAQEQVGVGITPRDNMYDSPYLYVNPYPFNQEITKNRLPFGIWHTNTDGNAWNGIKVEWSDIADYSENKIAYYMSYFRFQKKILDDCNASYAITFGHDIYIINSRNFNRYILFGEF